MKAKISNDPTSQQVEATDENIVNETTSTAEAEPVKADKDAGEESVNRSINAIPTTDNDVMDVSKAVAKNWTSDPMPLKWTNPAEFTTKVVAYEKSVELRSEVEGSRSPLSKKLEALDAKMDENLSYVKGYIAEKYGKENAQSYYKQFGIALEGTAFVLPTDRNDRKNGLKLLLKALKDNGFSKNKYGTDFWTPIQKEYFQMFEQATDVDGISAERVQKKNKLKEEILETLRALVHLLKANYPNSFETTLIMWGFQKGKY